MKCHSFTCLECGAMALKHKGHALVCSVCQASYPLLDGRVPILLPTDARQKSLGIEESRRLSLAAVQTTYDRAYAHEGLMGTDLDEGYDQTTKERLLHFGDPLVGKRILDVGTGIGKLWDYLQVPVDGYALDVSPVGVIKTTIRHPNVMASVSLAECLPYDDGFFDVVLAADTIEHTFSPKRALEEIHRVLKPNGIFSGSFPIPDSLRKWGWNTFVRSHPDVRMFFGLIRVLAKRILLFGRANFQPFDRDYGREEWIKVIESAGFEILVFEQWPETPLIPITYLVKAVRN